MSDVHELEQRLFGLQGERDMLAGTRTKEDVRTLAESWLAAACSRASGITAGLVLNQHAGPGEVQAVLGEFLLESSALVDFVAAKVEATTELSERTKKQRLGKLDRQIEQATAELREARKRMALEAVEREFAAAGEAA